MTLTKPNYIFQPADILLPAGNLRKWSVIACDQFTSDGEYWDAVQQYVGDCPSALRLMLPEYYLGRVDESKAAAEIQNTMREYLRLGILKSWSDCFVYLERRLSSGALRRGLMGVIDLEAYDYSPDAKTPIRASEFTVEDRLPPRVRVRRQAPLEMPHVMLFFNDPTDHVMREAKRAAAEILYDFALMGGGGQICGRRITGEKAWALAQLISEGDGLRFAVGDGNHSLAAARKCWLEKREHLSPEQQNNDPARFALVELVNIHDDAITFEPIHRVLFHTDPAAWFKAAEKELYDSAGRSVTLIADERRMTLAVKGASIGETIENIERFCRAYCARHGGEIDYIHGDDETAMLSQRAHCCGILLPQMKKEELFPSLEQSGPFPKKSFSIGLGPDKRYYLECRKIQ